MKQYGQKRHCKTAKKFYLQVGEDCMKTYQQPDDKETKNFGAKYSNKENIKKPNEKATLEKTQKDSKAKIYRDSLWTTLNKVTNWKTPGHNGIHWFWFKKFTSIHDRLAIEMNRGLQETVISEWITKEKTTLTQKDLQKGKATNNYKPITF